MIHRAVSRDCDKANEKTWVHFGIVDKLGLGNVLALTPERLTKRVRRRRVAIPQQFILPFF